MIIKNNLKLNTIHKGGLTFRFLETGDIYDVSYHDYQINLLKGNALDGSLMNVYMRTKINGSFESTALICRDVLTHVEFLDDKVVYKGRFKDINYQLDLIVGAFQWDIHVTLESEKTQDVELFYGQDVAIQNKSSVLSSEAYTVQYIDYKVKQDNHGYTLSAKQNQGAPQYLQIGSYSNNIGFSTDGFQFFGKSYKSTQLPEALYIDKLESVIKQYEFSYLTIQSEKISINKKAHFSFYGYYEAERLNSETKDMIDIDMLPYQIESDITLSKLNSTYQRYHVLNGDDLTETQVSALFPNQRHIEKNLDKTLSFFTDHHHHVVLKEKEQLVERPHGHLMIHGDILHVSDHVMATTNFMFGIFNSHIVLGNTSFNKFLGDLRNPLNVQKISGQRIYIKKDGKYHILSIPSYYEMGGATTRWYYAFEDDALIVDVSVDIHKASQSLKIYSKNHKKYDFIITQQILLDVNEYMGDITYQQEEDSVLFSISGKTMAAMKYPNLKYKMTIGKSAQIISESDFLGLEEQHGLFILKYNDSSEISIKTQASFDEFEASDLSYEQADELGTKYFKSILNQAELAHKDDQANMNKLNDTLFWYTHNALVHYASPHGLEQYNGAAWGTRDVCQGPVELFAAAGKYDLIREILLKVYQRQFIENGDFPQWFMFGKFYQIQAHEAHGDIIIWPLRTLGYYLQATSDFSILDEKVPYMSMHKNEFTESYGLIEHIKKQINTIKESFIPNTYLPRYGGGDWDDTLQPANHDLTTKMVSGWTVALLYESVHLLGAELESKDKELSEELLALAKNIKADYKKYMIVDGIPSGFVVFEDNNQLSYLLHPRDQKTGLKYRLLPFVRSFISELAEKEVMNDYINLIDKIFMHPDGVRLMDTAVKYEGGKKTYFVRAETAANFGREIGLQYVHAHIRYIESMAKIGASQRAYNAIFQIVPIQMKEHVKNAEIRQSNMYFSSSDADFNNRYEAKKDFELVRQGNIKVKGGWRLYSSGPGIFIHQIIHHILGVGQYHQDLHIDPVITKAQDGLTFTSQFEDKTIKITYHYGDEKLLINGLGVSYKQTQNSYRQSGYIIDKNLVLNTEEPIHIEVWSN
ncbi:MAG: hypothetical protein K8Q99_01675 [Acholeplasmataceae bacterium]|nr:hypothetical protein [Acholeplasmataceae bacterium]